jgi:hypothetical protein
VSGLHAAAFERCADVDQTVAKLPIDGFDNAA